MKQLSDKQLMTIRYLLEGKTYEEIAKILKISIGSISTWKKKPEFESVYQEKRRELYGQFWSKVVFRINHYADNAIEQLNKLIMDPETKDYVRCNACLGMLNYLSSIKQMDVDERLLDLERKLNEAIAVVENNQNRKPDSSALTPEEVDRIRTQILGMEE